MWQQLTLTVQPKVDFDTLDFDIPMPTDVVNVPDRWLDNQSRDIARMFRSETKGQFDALLEDFLSHLEPSPMDWIIEDTIDPLGIYIPVDRLIKIDENKIHRCSDYMKTQGALVEFEQLSKIVRIHEDNHALHHLAGDPRNKNEIWDKFMNNPPSVLEMLAQLFTFHAVCSDKILLNAFYELEKRSPPVYHLWRGFQETPKESVYWRARNKPDQIKKLLKGMGINCPSKVRSRKKIGPTATKLPVVEPGAYYMVNTCSEPGSPAYPYMLKSEKASAYGKRRYGIAKIKKGDTVFLYHNRVGIIAFGKAVDSYKENVKNDEYYVPVKFEWQIDPSKEPQRAITAQEINQKLNSKHPFRQAVWSVGEDMVRAIRDIAALK